MAFIPVSNIVEVKFDHTYFGTGGKGFVFHYEKGDFSAWSLADIDELLGLLVTWWDVSLQPLMNTFVTLNRIRARDLTAENGLQSETTTGLPLNGTRAGTPLQANVVFALKKATGFVGRSFRGRVYHFGLVTADIVNTNFVSTATVNSLETAYNASRTLTGAADTYIQRVVSRYSDGQPRVTGISTLIANFTAVDSRVDTNRNKLPSGNA